MMKKGLLALSGAVFALSASALDVGLLYYNNPNVRGWSNVDPINSTGWGDIYGSDTMTSIDLGGGDFNVSNLNSYDLLIVNYRTDNPGNIMSTLGGTSTPIISFAGYTSQSDRAGLHGGSATFESVGLAGAESTVVDASHPLFAGISTSNGAAIDILTDISGSSGALLNSAAIGDVLFTNTDGTDTFTGGAFLSTGTTLADGSTTTSAPILFLNLPDFASGTDISSKLSADGLKIVDNFVQTYAIPEPSSLILLGLAGLSVLAFRRRS